MKKDIKDYLHLYLNAGIGVYIFPDRSITNGFLERYKREFPDGEYAPLLTSKNYHQCLRDGYKPILRPLSDMTDKQKQRLMDHFGALLLLRPESVRELLTEGFDLFGLIEAGLAINKTYPIFKEEKL